MTADIRASRSCRSRRRPAPAAGPALSRRRAAPGSGRRGAETSDVPGLGYSSVLTWTTDLGAPTWAAFLIATAAYLAASLLLWRLRAEGTAPPEPPRGPVAAEEIITRLPVALLHVGHRGEVVSANPAARGLLGEIPEGATLTTLLDGLGRPVEDWVDDDEVEAVPHR